MARSPPRRPITSNGVSTTLTKYFGGANGLPTAERVGTNGPLSYLASDGQGTVSEALDGGGNVTFAQLYTPYGNARYSSGSSPTTLGYTGQRADGTTGLDDYHARYYDPVAGQFGSADTVNDGLNRYGYVRGNPETASDPSGHYACYDDPCTRGGGGSGSLTPSKETAPSSREPSICDDGPAICQQIISEFHNTDTQNTLLYIAKAGSSIGMRLLNWILKVGKTLGDSFIRWDGQTQGGAGYTDSGGFIHLQDLGDATNANTLIHEGVEAYYAIQYGVRTQASQQMDYLAQRYSGMYKSESGGKYDKNNGCDSDGENCMYWGAYGLSFQQGRRTADGKGYAGQPLIQAEVQFGVPIAPQGTFSTALARLVYCPVLKR